MSVYILKRKMFGKCYALIYKVDTLRPFIK